LRKILPLLILTVFLSGCATYKFQKSTSGSQGYLACYDGYPIAEYTLGKEKSLPELTLAKERFKRRRSTVEYYYKQMGQIESRLKAYLWEPPVMIVGFFGGVLRWPFTAVADYKYNHRPEYKAKIDKLDEEKDALRTARVNSLRKELDNYIAQDLSKESLPASAPLPAAQEVRSKTEAVSVIPEAISSSQAVSAVTKEEPAPAPAVKPALSVQAPEEVKPVVVEPVPAAKIVLEPPVAVINAQPAKGFSPLKVRFSSQKSHSKSGKIVSYLWDFGDGDTSTQKNPENTYWSTTFGSRIFTVTLTVKDQVGAASITTSTIEVITR
jgi:uncharacterized protein YceK